ncbi:MAG: histone deacetylase, partial [Deltaproteobacteria bacterium HGW-Deltaproteobacteria-17]
MHSPKHSVATISDPVFLQHVSPISHPERPDRLAAVVQHLQETGIWERLRLLKPRPATYEELKAAHDPLYVDRTLDRLSLRRTGYLDMGDTFFSPGTKDAALAAAGGCVDLALAVYAGEFEAGAALVRPPGHHADRDTAMGFCVFNNTAVAAHALLRAGAQRVAILDFDVHHGNGTQDIFYADPRVLYVSIHQSPLYPGTGAADEIGVGDGLGMTANVPLAPYCDDVDWLTGLERLLLPLIRAFSPEILLVGAGYDAHHLDTISTQQVTDAGYAAIAQRIVACADAVCGGKIVMLLEGGYHLEGLSSGVASFLRQLESRSDDPVLKPTVEARHSTISAIN